MPSPKIIGVLIVLMAFAVLSSMTFYYRGQYQTEKAAYDEFISKAQVLAAQQLTDNARKESERAQAIQAAITDRDAALDKLRNATANSSRLRAIIASLTASSSGKVCFRSEGFNAALSGITGLIEEGDGAIITDRAWYQAWPTN